MNDPLNDILERCVIVLLGSFNPAIFQPEWFLKHSIVPEEEIEGLTAAPNIKEIPEIGLKLEYGQSFFVTNDQAVINFKTFTMRTLRDKLEIISKDKNSFTLISNFIKKLFKILEETPLKAYGINFNEHYRFDENYDQIFNKFFSKNENLRSFFGQELICGFTLKTKQANSILTLTMRPSDKLKDGVYLKANFHYDISDSGVESLVNDFKNNFGLATEFFKQTISKKFGQITEYVSQNGELKKCKP
jgi:plasmid maintenance system killer protein